MKQKCHWCGSRDYESRTVCVKCGRIYCAECVEDAEKKALTFFVNKATPALFTKDVGCTECLNPDKEDTITVDLTEDKTSHYTSRY